MSTQCKDFFDVVNNTIIKSKESLSSKANSSYNGEIFLRDFSESLSKRAKVRDVHTSTIEVNCTYCYGMSFEELEEQVISLVKTKDTSPLKSILQKSIASNPNKIQELALADKGFTDLDRIL